MVRSLEKKKELENSGRGSVILGELLLLLRFMVTLLVTIFSVIWRFARNFSCICLKSYAQCDCVLVLLCFVLPFFIFVKARFTSEKNQCRIYLSLDMLDQPSHAKRSNITRNGSKFFFPNVEVQSLSLPQWGNYLGFSD